MAPAVRSEVVGGVARVTIDRPERRNALDGAVLVGLREALAAVRDDGAVRAVVLTGAGDVAFCAGADLAALGHPGELEPLADVFEDLWSLGKPSVARVRGYALAGGLGLALACDLVVAADDAVFGTPEIDLGLWPFMVTVPLLRAVAPKRALELMLTGRRVGAVEAERIGLVTRVVPVAELDAAVDELAAALAAKPPGAVRAGRESFFAICDLAAGPALDRLRPLLARLAVGPEAREGLAAFAEKRRPAFPPPGA